MNDWDSTDSRHSSRPAWTWYTGTITLNRGTKDFQGSARAVGPSRRLRHDRAVPGNGRWTEWVTFRYGNRGTAGESEGAGRHRPAPGFLLAATAPDLPAASPDLPLLDRARHHTGHELPLEREEHGQRDHHRDERAGRQDVDVVAELTYLRLQGDRDRLRTGLGEHQRDQHVV